ncbi:uncharacterized protein LOC125235884 [Leguminivora glycinivorella]|uniref:uncharacterized protein LOC125235884 n=1 Tax=Leguminivora glycinivorella TaxID=1035111 RepID=UPI00200BE208|nr:uncharacterized protein LOC125235884 [Leguminivora glycinivorella]
MAPIATYVFLDLGTTGKKKPIIEITELSMVAVDRQQFLDSISQATPTIPQFLNKLTRCFKPETQEIDYAAKKDGSGGFTKEELKDELPLNENCFELIDNFLYCLARPVCIIAHYAFHSDYLILRRYITKLQVQFSSELVCVDTHQMFYDILEEIHEEECIEEYFKQVASTPGRPPTSQDPRVKKVFNSIREFMPQIEHKMRISDRSKLLKQDVSNSGNSAVASCHPVPKQDSSNPGHSSKLSNKPVSGEERVNDLREKLKAKRRRFETSPKRATRQYPWGPEGNKPFGVSYKLTEIYTRVFRRPPRDAHKAEIDCMLMLEIAVKKLGRRFVDWIDKDDEEESNRLPFPSLAEEIKEERLLY